VAGLGLVLGGVAATDTYAGRLLRLWGPDVEDYRSLPTRPVGAGAAVRVEERLDPDWMRSGRLRYRGRLISHPAALNRLLEENGTTAFLILAGGRLVDERYYGGRNRGSLFKSFSITKSILSAAFGIAAGEGLISPRDPVGRFVGDAEGRLAALPLQHLLDNTAGFFYERGNLPWMQQPRMYYTTDARAYVPRAAARFEHEPGTRYVGEDLSPLLLGIALEAEIRRRYPGMTLSDYVSSRLWRPLGAGYPALFTLDHAGDGLEKVESGFTARAIDLARFGQLYLNGGAMNGRQVVPAEWVRASTTPPARDRPNSFPHGFHRNLSWGHYRPGQVRSDFFANGHFGQRIYVSPDKELVIVRLGSESGNVDWTELLAAIAAAWAPPVQAAGPPPQDSQGRQNLRSP
jgi:CubicO group peptidase (beta-lactamase class C family)